MRNIAITGSFSSGKSFVLKCVKSMGYKVFSSDDYVRELYNDKHIQKNIEDKIEKLNQFDRTQLAEIVFSDDVARKKLEEYIHPMVRQGIKDFEEKNKGEKILFTEVPLLFESGFNRNFPYSICIFCSEETRLKRAKSRGIENLEIFKKIKKIQLSQEEKKKQANFTINSEKSLEEIKISLNDIINKVI